MRYLVGRYSEFLAKLSNPKRRIVQIDKMIQSYKVPVNKEGLSEQEVPVPMHVSTTRYG
jgi:Na+/phosphate symporter